MGVTSLQACDRSTGKTSGARQAGAGGCYALQTSNLLAGGKQANNE